MYTTLITSLIIMTEQKWILYQTTNLVNGKIYVGVHKLANTKQSQIYLGSGGAMKRAIEKYGRESFTRVTLAEFSCAEDVYLAEAEMVDEEFAKRLDTYNMRTGGMGGVGYVPTEETRAKMRIIATGRVKSEEELKKIGDASRGNKYSVGRILSDATKSKMSASAKVRSKAKIAETSNKIRQKTALYRYTPTEEKAEYSLEVSH